MFTVFPVFYDEDEGSAYHLQSVYSALVSGLLILRGVLVLQTKRIMTCRPLENSRHMHYNAVEEL